MSGVDGFTMILCKINDMLPCIRAGRPDELTVARACNVSVHLMGVGVDTTPETVRFLMDFVRREAQVPCI